MIQDRPVIADRKEKMETHPPHLEPSELVRATSWESFYGNSLEYLSSSNRRRNPANSNDDANESDEEDDSDPGTSWFTEHNAPQKVLDFLTSYKFPLAPVNQPSPTSILDLGTGNGSMLSLLREEGGFAGPMVGVDYSPKSIELARRLCAHTAGEEIRFEVWDIFNATPERIEWFPREQSGFDIVLDKGTFDAVSLSGEVVEAEGAEGPGGQEGIRTRQMSKRRICEKYPAEVLKLVRRGGFFVITSCNWTETELIEWFTRKHGNPETGEGVDDDGFIVWDRIAYRKYIFGGQEGQGVCTICFRRKERDE
ncbi:hypothetical protein FQN57_007319 [Myotisia sp. PD_48]|nr:hypothetical protein FQN57_007319 [Myotisia sp. PD_48]